MRAPTATDRRRGASAEANMTPMIDVVFLLIIFFLVSSHLARRESRVQLDLPVARTGEADADTAPRLTINVDAQGRLALGATPMTEKELATRLSSEAQSASNPPRVRLRGDRATPYSAIEPALAACAEAGLNDISLAVYGDASGAGR